MRIDPINDDQVTEAEREIFERARRTYGWLPRTVRVMAHGSAADLYLDAGERNSNGSLGRVERELVAIATAASNDCDYCLTAHTVAARMLGLGRHDVIAAREADSPDSRIAAILRFASAVLTGAGRVADADLGAAREAGLSDRELVDIVSVVAENTLGNMINNLAETELDPALRRAWARLMDERRAVA